MISTESIDLINSADATQDAQLQAWESTFRLIEGTIQRVNYHTGELRVISEGHPWEFVLDDDSHLWFNGGIVPFRCFQPLDHVKIQYAKRNATLFVEALYLWEEESPA